MILLQSLLNGASKAMNVNGSVTPQSFSYSPVSGSVQIKAVTIVIRDEGNSALSNFGAISALSNGLQIKVNIGGVESTLFNIKDNADMCAFFSEKCFGSSAVLSLLGITTPVGFGASNNIFCGEIDFDRPILLTDSDSITGYVRDNLSQVDTLNMAIMLERD